MRVFLLLVALILGAPPAWGGDIVGHGELCRKVTDAIGGTPEETINRLGQPESVREDAVNIPHLTDAQDTEVELEYPNGIVLFHYLGRTDKYLLLTAALPIQLFSKGFRANFPDSVEKVAERWGEPDEHTRKYVRYYCTFEGVQWVDIQFNEGRVSGIAYTGYVD